MEHNMNLNPEPFEQMRSGRKTIELRLWDERRSAIRAGDTIVFTNTADPQAKLRIQVLQLHRFSDFEALYAALDLLKCGYTPENVAQAKASDMDYFYTPERQKQYGVVGIEISLLS